MKLKYYTATTVERLRDTVAKRLDWYYDPQGDAGETLLTAADAVRESRLEAQNIREKLVLPDDVPNSLCAKVDRSESTRSAGVDLAAWQMGKKPAARQPSHDVGDHSGPSDERGTSLFRTAEPEQLEDGRIRCHCGGAIVRGDFNASRLVAPESASWAKYFRLLFIGYFWRVCRRQRCPGLRWRAADSLSLRAFLDLDVTEAPTGRTGLDAVANGAASDRRGNARGGWHVGAGCGWRERVCLQGKTVGVDATIRWKRTRRCLSIERQGYRGIVRGVRWRQLAKASGIETPTRAELARFEPVPEGQ